MISPSFNLREFIETVQDKDCLEIISLAQQEVQMAEQRSFSVKGAVRNRNDGSTRYAADLKGLIFLLTYGAKPMGVGIAPFWIICKNLVDRKQIKPEIMTLFK